MFAGGVSCDGSCFQNIRGCVLEWGRDALMYVDRFCSRVVSYWYVPIIVPCVVDVANLRNSLVVGLSWSTLCVGIQCVCVAVDSMCSLSNAQSNVCLLSASWR